MTKHKGSRIHKHNQVQHVKQSVHIHLDTRKKVKRKKKARAFRPAAVLQLPPVNRVVNNHIVLPENAGRPPLGFFQQQAVKAQQVAQSNLVKQIKTGLGEPEKKELVDTKKVAEKEAKIADDALAGVKGVLDKKQSTPEQKARAKLLFPDKQRFTTDYYKMEKLLASAQPAQPAPAQPALPRSQQPTASSTSRTQVEEFKEPSFMEKVMTKNY